MAFTIGKYGVEGDPSSSRPEASFYVTGVLFVVGLLGTIAAFAGFTYSRFLMYDKGRVSSCEAHRRRAASLPTDAQVERSAARSPWSPGHSGRLFVNIGRHDNLLDDGLDLCRAGPSIQRTLTQEKETAVSVAMSPPRAHPAYRRGSHQP